MGKLKMILAVDENWGIGINNSLPWNCPEDLASFKKLTTNSAILMGTNTWNSLPKKPLPNRTNIVLGTSSILNADYVIDYRTPKLDEIVHEFIHQRNTDVWIIGGSTVYKQFINKIDYLYITRIAGVYNCDAFFNPFEYSQFLICDTEILSDNAILEIYKRI